MPVASISIDDARVRQMLSAAPEKITRGLRRLVEGAAIDIQRQERINAPVGVTGQLRGSIRYKFDAANLSAEIVPEVDYGDDVEFGSPPRWESVAPGSPLEQWARMHGINPFAVQHAIAQRGTKPHPFAVPTLEMLRDKINNDFAVGINAVVEEINRG